ncbi:hypothetical protein PVK06_012379 [Gossypium arboreum]|uniref:Uncharacterized protein n=1 Tax=Gossypium arboreum TaxID=29729 RepID=A0ABR0QC01_GOSAR|nr:hypothetical protein PVK06_012379 [Gossypium arboreum]
MTSTLGSDFHEESQSISKPPYFKRVNYSYWKTRVMLFIQANALVPWDIIMDGPSISQKQGDQLVLKIKRKLSEEDKRNA